jgi:HAE1 family hydrophobic/amphiphilic exporter-1
VSLTRLFLKRPTLAFVFVIVTLLAAIYALQNLIVQQSPNSDLPTVSISASYSGASTTELRDEIALPLENALAGAPNLDHLDTTIQSGAVSITATFILGTPDTENIANVEKALQSAQKQLPSDLTAPSIRVADPSQPNVVSVALLSKKYNESDLAAIANNSIVPAVEQYPGVSSVGIYGQTQPSFNVLVDPGLLAASNLTITDVINAITPNNVRAPGGIVYQPGRETQLDIRGDITTPQTVADLPIHVAYTTASAAATGGGGAAAGGSSASGASAGASDAGGGASSSGATASAGSAGAGTTSASGANGAATTGAGRTSTQRVPRAQVTAPPPYFAQVGSATAAPGAQATAAAVPKGGTNLGTSSSSGAASSAAGGTGTSADGGGGTSAGGTSSGTGTGTTGIAGSTSAGTGSASAGTAAAGSTGAAGTGGAALSAGTAANSTTTTSTGTSGGSLVTSSSAVPNVPIDPSVTVSASGGTTAAAAAGSAMPSNSTASGSAGTSTSPFVGSLDTWAVPSADKRISDVASVADGSAPVRTYASLNGRQGIAINVQKASTASEVTVSNTVVDALPKLRQQFPGIDFEIERVQSVFTQQALDSVEHTLIEGIILTAVVMLFFLKSWRNAVVVMVAIPTSLGVTLLVMKLMNLTLDTVSLLGMTLVIGILIDDSTVVLENIERHHDNGESAADSALRGRSEIGTAAIVITLVDVVVFLPIAFIGGSIGRQLSEFGIVVAVATLTSLLVSFTITPALAGLWSMKSEWKPWPVILWFNDRFDGLRSTYADKWLPAAVNNPIPIVVISVVLCGLAFLLVPIGWIGEEYQPAGDQGQFTVQVTYSPGHALDDTRTAMEEVERVIRGDITNGDLQFEQTTSGGYAAPFGGFVSEGNVGQTTVFLTTTHKIPTQTYVTQVQKDLKNKLPDAAILVKAAAQQGGGSQQPIDFLVSTTDGTDPTAIATKVADTLAKTPGAIGVSNSAGTVAPQMEVRFDRIAAQALDVSIGDAATAVRAAFGGAQAAQIETQNKGYTQILVIYPRTAQTRLADVLQIPVRSTNGGIVRVGDFAHLAYVPAPLTLTRENRADVVHVSANVAPGASLSGVTQAFQKAWRATKPPRNVVLKTSAQGQQQLMTLTLKTLGTSVLGSFVLVFLMIVALYNSYRTPFVTMFAVPLATIGAFGALWIFHQTLNLFSLIGMVLLVGLVTKNGILLVDYADTMRTREGMEKNQAMLEAAKTRFRPIVMTTAAMITGMLPLALGLEPGGQTHASLGIAVIGGLISSLILTLLIVPIMYKWIAPKNLMKEVDFEDDKPEAERKPIKGQNTPTPQPG